MSTREARERAILLMLFAIWLSVLVVIFPDLFPVLFVSVLLVSKVVYDGLVGRLDDYTWGG